MEHAITGNMANLMAVMRAVKRFKKLLSRKRPRVMDGIFGRDSRIVSPPRAMREGTDMRQSRSTDTHDRKPFDSVLVTEGVHRPIDVDDDLEKLPKGINRVAVSSPESYDNPNLAADTSGDQQGEGETGAHFAQRKETDSHKPHASDPSAHRHPNHRSYTFPEDDHAKGHAHDPLEDKIFLSVGTHAGAPEPAGDPRVDIVCESPPGVELNIYEQAYQQEMNRIMEQQGQSAAVYLNRRVEHRDDIRSHSNVIAGAREAGSKIASRFGAVTGLSGSSLAKLVKQKKQEQETSSGEDAPLETKSADLSATGASDNGPSKPASTRQDAGPATGPADRSADTGPDQSDGTQDSRANSVAPSLSLDLGTLDAHKGAMPGMAGGFPRTPEPESTPS